jgi:exopolysaccharide biosynthesis polyprenyl glycosylphosphotransferase
MSQQDLQNTAAVARGAQTTSLDDLTGELFLLESPGTIAQPHTPSRVVAERDSAFRRLLGASDIIATVLALVATATFTHTQQVYWSMFAAVLFVVPLGKLMGLYDRDAHVLHHTTLDEAPKLFTLALMSAVGAFIARDLSVIGSPGIGTKQLVFLTGVLTMFLCAGRVIARWMARVTSPPERLLVVGGDSDAEELRRKIELTPGIKATIVGRVPIAFNELPGGHSQVLGSAGDLRRVVETFEIDRIVVIPGNRNPDEVSDVVRAVKSIGMKISLMPQLFDAIGWAVETDDVAGEQVMGVRDFRMTASSRLVKRATDIAGASLLLLLAAPVMVVTAIAIRLDSRGPVLFRQERVGRRGDEFEIVKFRTMYDGAEQAHHELSELNETTGLFKIGEDPRVTRIGGFLRRSHIDELPQLLNVLRGEMSLVGPRPLVPAEDVAITGWYRRRSQITPGITGVWQLHGPVCLPLDEMVKLDYLYVANWSWWGDIKIMLRTARQIVTRRGI